jgi:hypothetical protein
LGDSSQLEVTTIVVPLVIGIRARIRRPERLYSDSFLQVVEAVTRALAREEARDVEGQKKCGC